MIFCELLPKSPELKPAAGENFEIQPVAIKKVPIPISAIFSFDCNARNTKFCRKLYYVISDVISKFDAVSIKIVHFRAILLFTLLTGQSDHVSTGICITCLLAFAYDVESH